MALPSYNGTYICCFPHIAAGQDFSITDQTVTFGPTDTEMFVTVPIIPDNIMEMNESFFGILNVVVGGNVMIAQPNATVVIIDDDNRKFTDINSVMFVPTVVSRGVIQLKYV